MMSVSDEVASAARERLGAAPGMVLDDRETRDVLAPLRLPFVPSVSVESPAAAAQLGLDWSTRAAFKVISDQALHKSDLGLVLLDIPPREYGEAYARLDSRRTDLGISTGEIIAQPMASAGVDMFVGASRDPVFGAVIMVGLGGTTVELFRDVARCLPPVDRDTVRSLLEGLRSYPLLSGFRGSPSYDLSAFCDLVVKLGDCVTQVPEIAELDLNPVRILADGSVSILDARARLETAPPAPRTASTTRDLSPLLRPRSIAIVGASRDVTRPGGRVVQQLLAKGFRGEIYLINPAGGEIQGLPAHPSLAALPARPDHVCIAIAAEGAVQAVAESARRGVPAVTVFASGFSETGPAGSRLERRLQDALAGSATVLCGPNTIGIVSTPHRMALTFSQALSDLPFAESGVSLVAQSGAVAGSLVSRELARGYGLGDWVTVGNQVDLDVADFISYLSSQPTTRAIAVFLEGMTDGLRLRQALDTARSNGHPVVAFKTGVTEDGRRAVASHSGALAGAAESYAAVFDQDGAIQVNDLTQLLEVAWVLAKSPQVGGSRAAILSTSGGAASTAVDLLPANGLLLAPLSSDTRDRLADALPPFAHATNPLDVTAEGTFAPGVVSECVSALLADPSVDLLCVVLTSVAGEDAVRLADQIVSAWSSGPKPVLVTWLIAPELAAEGMRRLIDAGIRVFDEPSRMMFAAHCLVKAAESLRRPLAHLVSS